MAIKIITTTETGEGFLSPTDIDNGKYIGSIFLEQTNCLGEIIGFVYHDVERDFWVMETLDAVSEEFDTFLDLYEEEIAEWNYVAFVKD